MLQEAALAGVPSVLADPLPHRTGTLRGDAVLAPPQPQAYGEAIHRLLTDPQAARAIGARARQRALAYTPAGYAEEMRHVYAAASRRQNLAALPDSHELAAAGGQELLRLL